MHGAMRGRQSLQKVRGTLHFPCASGDTQGADKTSASHRFIWLLYGYVEPHLPGMGFYGYLIQFGLAYALGRLAHRAASYKLGTKIILTALLGLAVGLVLGPTREIIMSSVELSQQPDEEGVTSNILSTHIIHLAIFTVGLLMPLWKKN